MKKLSLPSRLFTSLLVLFILLSATGCSAAGSGTDSGSRTVTPPTPAPTPMLIVAPASPASLPVLLAASQMENAQVKIIPNNSQANTLFLRGEAQVLVSGLSVGLDLYKNDAPVQVINSYVAGMSFLVTRGKAVSNFAELKGKEIYLPFEGSPTEEVTQFLAAQEGLSWKKDIQPIYSPFNASVELLNQGKAQAVVLPEPFVSMIEGKPELYISMDYYVKWNEAAHTDAGYPQVAAFVNRDWATAHPKEIAQFNDALAKAIQMVQQDPSAAVKQYQADLNFPPEILLHSLQRTRFFLTSGKEMQQEITSYYRLIGKPLNDTSAPFFYLPEK